MVISGNPGTGAVMAGKRLIIHRQTVLIERRILLSNETRKQSGIERKTRLLCRPRGPAQLWIRCATGPNQTFRAPIRSPGCRLRRRFKGICTADNWVSAIDLFKTEPAPDQVQEQAAFSFPEGDDSRGRLPLDRSINQRMRLQERRSSVRSHFCGLTVFARPPRQGE
jgi:hypothetical protein